MQQTCSTCLRMMRCARTREKESASSPSLSLSPSLPPSLQNTNTPPRALRARQQGFKKEDLAVMALLEFPFEIVFAVLAGRRAAKHGRPLDLV